MLLATAATAVADDPLHLLDHGRRGELSRNECERRLRMPRHFLPQQNRAHSRWNEDAGGERLDYREQRPRLWRLVFPPGQDRAANPLTVCRFDTTAHKYGTNSRAVP